MKKKIMALIALLLALITGTCQAAHYTLPEKMSNQLAIGSGLKGTFIITAEGEKFRTPFLEAVTDAEFSLRGISSDKDFHYYVFQSDEQENQSAVSELYRKDGICYFRSDMVQGKILSLPTLGQYLDVLFPATGENGSSSSFVSKILSLSKEEKKDKWDPVLTRYQNELELWLADFTVNADTVKLDSGFSALDFTYEIPMEQVLGKIVSLYESITSDPEAVALLGTVMTDDEKKIYLNGNLLDFYREALQSLVLDQPVKMNKRVSAMGDLLRFRLELPLDERTTGYRSLDIETVDQTTVYTLKKDGQILVLGLPDTEILKKKDYGTSFQYARINTEAGEDGIKDNISVRIDIKKSTETHEEEEKSHESEHYVLNVTQDTSFLPEGTDPALLPEYDPMRISVDLHYSSKFAQNSATSLDITAEVTQAESVLKAEGTVKTAAPWLFMPFEVVDPIETGAKKEEVLIPYLTDWISNAASMIRHTAAQPEADPEEAGTETAETAEPAENAAEDPESVPLPEEPEEQEEAPEETETEAGDEDAEAQPLEETEDL